MVQIFTRRSRTAAATPAQRMTLIQRGRTTTMSQMMSMERMQVDHGTWAAAATGRDAPSMSA